MNLLPAALAAEGAAAVTAILLARRRPDHTPAAIAIVLYALLPLARIPLVAVVPTAVDPYEGAKRVFVYLDGAAVLAAVAILPGLALAVSVVPERRRLVVSIVTATWALASIALAAAYPSPMVRGGELQRLYLAADLIALAVSCIALVGWTRRTIAEGRSPRPAHMIAIGLVLLDLGILLIPHSPWREGTWISPFGRFDIIQIGIVVFFALFAAAQGVLWRFSSR